MGITRQKYFNQRAREMGDLMRLQEKQSGWHKTDDNDRIPFIAYIRNEIMPSTARPPYPSSIDDLASCLIYLNEIKRLYNLHRVDTDVHANADSANDISSADATDLASANTLANELKTDLNLHYGTGGGASHTHTFTGTAHSHDILFKDAAVVDGATTRVNVGTNLLGANTGGDITVAGAGANGGVRNTTAGGTISAGGGGGSSYHTPYADNINTIVSASATDLATLKTLTLELVTSFRNHLFIGAARTGEELI